MTPLDARILEDARRRDHAIVLCPAWGTVWFNNYTRPGSSVFRIVPADGGAR